MDRDTVQPAPQLQDLTQMKRDDPGDNTMLESKGFSSSNENVNQVRSSDSHTDDGAPTAKKPWWKIFLEPGSAPQIVTAAVLAIALGLGVKEAVGTVPQAAITLVGIPGVLWLRALKAVGEFRVP